MSKLHICLTTNKKWVRFAQRAVYDIIIRKHTETEIAFYVLVDDMEGVPDGFKKFGTIDGIDITFKRISAMKEFDGNIKVSKDWLGPFKHLKFLIPELDIFKDVKRVLYLDVDMLARRDLTNLYNTDLDGYPLGCVKNYMKLISKNFIYQNDKKFRFESGLILMDLPKLRELHFTELCKSVSSICDNDHILLDTVGMYMTKELDPKAHIPYHFISTGNTIFNDISNWNILCNTKYKSIQDLVDRSYLWHFAGDKEKCEQGMPLVQACFNISERRLTEFLDTGVVMPWKKEDDDALYMYKGVIPISENQTESDKEKEIIETKEIAEPAH